MNPKKGHEDRPASSQLGGLHGPFPVSFD